MTTETVAVNIASLPALNLTNRPIPTGPDWPTNLTFSLGAAWFFMPVSPPTAPTVIVTDTTNRQ